MEKMTPESLKQAIHRIAEEANAPYAPTHLMQETRENLLKQAAQSQIEQAVGGLLKLKGTLKDFDRNHHFLPKQDHDAIQQAFFKLDKIWQKIKKA